MGSRNTEDADDQLAAITREFLNYSERIARSLAAHETDIWCLYLAATGRMLYPDQAPPGIPFPDGPVNSPQGTRHRLWKAAMLEVLEILDPLEARLRTGYELEQLHLSVESSLGGAGAIEESS